MTNRRKNLLRLVLAAGLLILAGAVGLALYAGYSGSYSVQLTRAQKYLEAQEFENAVLCYQRAIEAEPKKAESYLGLAEAYMGLNKMALAENVLNTGYEQTGSARIKLMVETYFGANAHLATAKPGGLLAGTDAPIKLNAELLSSIAENTYDDYRRAQALTSEERGAGSYRAVAQELGLELSYYNTDQDSRVLDANTGKPYSTRKPNEITVQDLSLLFGGQTVTFEDLNGMGLEQLELKEDAEHGWVVTFVYNGCEAAIACGQDGTVTADAWNRFVPGQSEEEEEEKEANLTGTIVNAQTGSGVSGATLTFLQQGRKVLEVKSESGGRYAAALEPGSYTVRIRCNGFVEEEFEVRVNQSKTTQQFTISSQLAQGEIRIVLEWGSSPRDLDSYLDGTTDSGQQVHTSFGRKKATASDGTVLAELDVDDVTGYGPETTTLYAPDGVYEFTVRDFHSTGTMNQSGATVKVYVGDKAPTIIEISPDVVNHWFVCRIDHGEVEVVNAPA